MSDQLTNQALPKEIDGFTVVRLIAKTGLSEVFEVMDRNGARFCLKRLLSDLSGSSSELAQNFHNEAKLLSQINHPNVIRVERVGRENGQYYICLELIEGKSLASLIKPEELMPFETFFRLALQVVDGLATIHRKGILHKDIKPDNILIHREGVGDGMIPKIADFGLSSNSATGSAQFVGTLAYISPEQAGIVDWPVDRRSDLYSLGVVLYEMIAGSPPFVSESGSEVLSSHLLHKPKPLQELRRDVPPLLERIVLKMLEKRQEDRYRSADGLLHDLREAQKRFTGGNQDPVLTLDAGANEDELSEGFVGREKELAVLQAAMDKARSREFSMVFVGGVAGVGKSRILREFENRALVQGAQFAYGKCYEFSRVLPCFVLGEALESFRAKINKHPADTARRIKDMIRAKVQPYAAELVQLAPGYAEIFEEKTTPKYGGEENDRQRLHALVCLLLESISHPGAPLVLLLDDLQWADGIMISLLRYLASSKPKLPVVIVCTYRSEEVKDNAHLEKLLSDSRSQSFGKEIELQPFDINEIYHLIAMILGMDSIAYVPTPLAMDVHKRTGGNAFFIGELLKAYISAGALAREKQSTGETTEERWVFREETALRLGLPEDVAYLVLRRLDELDGDSKQILGSAAWIGTGFGFDELSAVCDGGAERVFACLRAAVGQRVLQENIKGTYRFYHDRIHEACRKLLEDDQRRALHLRIVQHLEKAEGAADEIVFALAEHALHSGDPERIHKHCLRAAEAAYNRHSVPQALAYFQAVLKAMPSAPDSTRTKMRVADVFVLLGKYEEALANYQELLESASDGMTRAALLSQVAECAQRKGDYESAKKTFSLALKELGVRLWTRSFWLAILIDRAAAWVNSRRIALWKSELSVDERSSRSAVINVLKKLWMVYIVQDIRPIPHISYRMLAVSSRIGPSEELAVSHQYLALALANANVPDWEKSISHARKSVDVGKSVNAEHVVAGSMVRLAAISTWKGASKDALMYSDRARDMLITLGNLWDLGNAYIFAYFSRRSTGDLPEAQAIATSLIDLGNRTGSKGTLSSGEAKLGEVLHLRGEVAAARESLDKAIAIAEQNSLGFDLFQAYKALGQCLVREGRLTEAREQFSKALDILRKKGGAFFRAYISEAYLGWAETVLKDRDAKPELLREAHLAVKKCWKPESYFRELGHVYRLHALHEGFVSKRIDVAKKYFDMAIERFQAQGRPIEEALTRMDAALVLSSSNHIETVAHLKKAFVAFEAHHAPLLRKECKRRLKLLGEIVGDESQAAERSMRELLDALLEISLASVSSLDETEQARAILDKLVKLMGADRALLFTIDESDRAVKFHLGRQDEKDILSPEGYSTTMVNRVIQTREPIVVAGTEEGALLGSNSAIANNLLSMVAAPVLLREEVLGAIYLDHKMVKGVFAEKDLVVLQALAKHIGVALQAVKISQLQLSHREMEKDLEVTRAVQSLLVPKQSAFGNDHIALAGVFRSATQSGGDWWWYHVQPDGTLLAIVGDVTGHGAGPAMITAAVASCVRTFREIVGQSSGPLDVAKMLETLNEVLFQICNGEYWMGLTVIEVNPAKEEVWFWSAGSPVMLLMNPGMPIDVVGGGGDPLGARKLQFAQYRAPFLPGAKLLVATDGLYEMTTPAGRHLGTKGACRLVAGLETQTAEEFRAVLQQKVNELSDGKPAEDDLTFVVIERRNTASSLAGKKDDGSGSKAA